MNAVDIPEGGFCPEYYAHQEYMARFEAKHGMASLAEFNKPVSDAPRQPVPYAPEDEDEFADEPQQTALEKLNARGGPFDIDEIIAALKADNPTPDTKSSDSLSATVATVESDRLGPTERVTQGKRSRRKPGEIERAAQAARQYLEADGGAQPVEAVLAAVLDATGLTVPEAGAGRMRFRKLAGLESRPHYRTGRTGCEYTEWFIPTQDSQVTAITQSEGNLRQE